MNVCNITLSQPIAADCKHKWEPHLWDSGRAYCPRCRSFAAWPTDPRLASKTLRPATWREVAWTIRVGTGEMVERCMRNLGSCLAVAGGLCAAYRFGDLRGRGWGKRFDETAWAPNVSGRPAPGWSGP